MYKVTVAVAAAFLLAACGTGEPAGESASTPPSAPASPPVSKPDPATTEPAAPESTVVEFTVEGGERASGPAEVEVAQGEQVEIVVTADARDELHLHGYDETADVEPGKPARLKFTADLPGVWELELHHGHGVLTELKVTG